VIYADLHIHTTYSDDSSVRPKTLVETLVKHSFVKVAAVTDHNTVRGNGVIRQLASAYPDILIIPSVEITTPLGDVVVLGAEETPPKPWTVRNVVDFAKENDLLSVVAHPYREYGMGDLAKNYKFDAVEVVNGGSSPFENEQARQLAKLLDLPGTGGSDAHRQQDLFYVYTEIQAGLDVDEILHAIRKGLTKAMQRGTSIRF
jgi:predicted metal-dependent phosphoesterase TrpH